MQSRDPASSKTPGPTCGPWICAAIAGAVPAVLFGAHNTAALLSGGLANPDSAMRMVRLHDIVAAGRPLHAVMRDGSGDGTLLHWSHLLDSLLLVLAAPFAAFMGWDAALHLIGLAFGPLCMGGLGLTAAWACLPQLGRSWAWLAAVAAGAAPVLLTYGMPGVVHHHVLLALIVTAACGWSARLLQGSPAWAGGMALGGWAGAGLWLSPESLPFTLMAIGAIWVSWFSAPRQRLGTAMVAAGAAFLLVTAAAWLADPPAPGLMAIEPDRISLPFVLLAAASLLTAGMARATGRRILTLSFGITLACLWLVSFPQMLHGTDALMAPEAAAAFFGGIAEMQPVHDAPGVFEYLLGGVFATAATLCLAWRRPTPVRVYAMLCVAGMTALAAAHVRFGAYPAVAGAIMLPVALRWVTARARPALRPAARLALVLPLLAGPFLAPLAARAAPGNALTTCPMDGAIALLTGFPEAVVLADVNDTPDLLYRTQVRTVGSLYHRNPAGFLRLRAAWRSVPGERPAPELLATRASLVLVCPGVGRSMILEGLPATTLLDRLMQGEPPAWLHRIGDSAPGGYVLYTVVL